MSKPHSILEARVQRALEYWRNEQLSYNGPVPLPWETMAAFAAKEIDLVTRKKEPMLRPLPLPRKVRKLNAQTPSPYDLVAMRKKR